MHLLLKEELLVHMGVGGVHLSRALATETHLEELFILLLECRFEAVDLSSGAVVSGTWEITYSFDSDG